MQAGTNEVAGAGLAAKKLTLKVFGVGGAGGNAVDYLARQDLAGVSIMAINTDARALSQLALADKMTLGAKLTRGLGAGGDPNMGRAAAEEDLEKMRELCAGADVVCIVAGLGGGTGTGAGPVIAKLAKESGALVLGIVVLPFQFEGPWRGRQAQMGLRDLKEAADGVICLPNEKISKLIDEKTGIEAALKITNDLIAQGVRGIWRLLTQTGLINVDFNDLCAVLRDRHEESALATVEASGENRSHEVVQKLMTHPFLDAGQSLANADAVLVSLAGGPDLTMAEVNRVMEQINRSCENAHIIMGAGIHESHTGRLSVTLVASRQNGEEQEPEQRPMRAAQKDSAGAGQQQVREIMNPSAPARPASRYVAPAPETTQEQAERLMNTQGTPRSRKKGGTMRQSTLQLEIVSKGRFEKSEPTIHHGEDLDVPTYIRRGVVLLDFKN